MEAIKSLTRGILLLIVQGMLLVAHGQSSTPTTSATPTDKIIPPSPNAASLGSYGNVPVSLYSGTVDLSIPIYEIKTAHNTVPISLSYT